MPARTTVEAFCAQVEAGDYVGAIERYYADDASTRENVAAPTQGKALLIDKERKVMASYERIVARQVTPFVIEGDRVVCHWRFEFIPANGPIRTLEEVALQTWRGEQLLTEEFFYNPKQMAPQTAI